MAKPEYGTSASRDTRSMPQSSPADQGAGERQKRRGGPQDGRMARARAKRGEPLECAIAPEHALSAQRILELAKKAHLLYLARNAAERGQLLKTVLLNCATDGVSLTPTYRKPFDVIFERAKNEEWSGRLDLNQRPPGPEEAAGKLSCCPA